MKKIREPTNKRAEVKLNEDPLIYQFRIPKSQLKNQELLELKETIMF